LPLGLGLLAALLSSAARGACLGLRARRRLLLSATALPASAGTLRLGASAALPATSAGGQSPARGGALPGEATAPTAAAPASPLSLHFADEVQHEQARHGNGPDLTP